MERRLSRRKAIKSALAVGALISLAPSTARACTKWRLYDAGTGQIVRFGEAGFTPEAIRDRGPYALRVIDRGDDYYYLHGKKVWRPVPAEQQIIRVEGVALRVRGKLRGQVAAQGNGGDVGGRVQMGSVVYDISFSEDPLRRRTRRINIKRDGVSILADDHPSTISACSRADLQAAFRLLVLYVTWRERVWPAVALHLGQPAFVRTA